MKTTLKKYESEMTIFIGWRRPYLISIVSGARPPSATFS